jgi:hypothetical protein
MNAMPPLRVNRVTVWLVMAVLLLGALAPTVSRALAALRSGQADIEVCTSQGPRRISPGQAGVVALAASPGIVRPGDAPGGSRPPPVLDHCPFCLLVAERLGPPPAAPMHLFDAESGLARPDAQALAFRTTGLASALARGPPRKPSVI